MSHHGSVEVRPGTTSFRCGGSTVLDPPPGREGDTMSNQDSGPEAAVKGAVEGAKGKIKEVAGAVTGRDDLQREGEAQQDKADSQREVAEQGSRSREGPRRGGSPRGRAEGPPELTRRTATTVRRPGFDEPGLRSCPGPAWTSAAWHMRRDRCSRPTNSSRTRSSTPSPASATAIAAGPRRSARWPRPRTARCSSPSDSASTRTATSWTCTPASRVASSSGRFGRAASSHRIPRPPRWDRSATR